MIEGLAPFVFLLLGIIVLQINCPVSENRCLIYFVQFPGYLRPEDKFGFCHFIMIGAERLGYVLEINTVILVLVFSWPSLLHVVMETLASSLPIHWDK